MQSADGLSIDVDNKVVTVSAAALNKKNVTADSGYKLALAAGISSPTTTGATWTYDNNVATYRLKIIK